MEDLKNLSCNNENSRYEDIPYGKKLHIENKDVIITDPCYFVKKNILDTSYSTDWDKCDYGRNMEVLGFKIYLVSNTIYGDWSCTTFNTDTKEAIGEFCADAGLAGVFLLDEILEYNSDFNYHEQNSRTTTWLKKITGDIYIEKRHHKGNDKWWNDTIHVVGKGNINFRTEQTGI